MRDADIWLHRQFADGSTQHKFLSGEWSVYFGWEFTNHHEPKQSVDRSKQELKELCAIAARSLPQDGIRESWVVYLDHVREYDPTKKVVAYGTRHIRQKQIAADLKEVENRQSQGAVPGQIAYVPYVRTVEAPFDPSRELTEQVLEAQQGPLYEYKFDTVHIDDIYGACAAYCLHLMTAGREAASAVDPPPEPLPAAKLRKRQKAVVIDQSVLMDALKQLNAKKGNLTLDKPRELAKQLAGMSPAGCPKAKTWLKVLLHEPVREDVADRLVRFFKTFEITVDKGNSSQTTSTDPQTKFLPQNLSSWREN